MPQEFSVAGARVVVVGAARSGLAAAELLVRKGARVTLTDAKADITAADRLRALGVAVELGGHRQDTFDQADLIVPSPGVPPQLPELQRAIGRGVSVIGELEDRKSVV